MSDLSVVFFRPVRCRSFPRKEKERTSGQDMALSVVLSAADKRESAGLVRCLVRPGHRGHNWAAVRGTADKLFASQSLASGSDAEALATWHTPLSTGLAGRLWSRAVGRGRCGPPHAATGRLGSPWRKATHHGGKWFERGLVADGFLEVRGAHLPRSPSEKRPSRCASADRTPDAVRLAEGPHGTADLSRRLNLRLPFRRQTGFRRRHSRPLRLPTLDQDPASVSRDA